MNSSVLIVGAGPTGLAVAVHLAMHNVPVRIIDEAQGPAVSSRALGLQPRGAEALERIGALGDLPSRSQTSLTMSYNDGPKTVLQFRVGDAVAAQPKQTLLVSQAEVEGTLRRRLAEVGGAVEWATQLEEATQDASEVKSIVVSGDGSKKQVSSDWLIGCDGAHSRVRKIAAIDFPGRKLIERLLMADVEADWPYDRNGSTTWMDAGHMLSVTALPDSLWRVFTEPPPELPEELEADEIADRVLAEFARRSGMPRTTVSGVRWASEFRIHRRLADTYRRRRILIAGDAAHVQSPSGGQGQNTGLGDAENLAWKLTLVARGRAPQQLLDSYESERRPLARKVLAATSTAVGVMLPDTIWKRWLRDLLVLPAFRLSSVQRRLWFAASQLGISYRGGPLAPRSRFRFPARRARAGDRMPDVLCSHLDGTETTLHAAVSACWLVVATDRHEAERHARAAGMKLGEDLVIPLTSRSIPHSDVCLIRPDGHLGWRGSPSPGSMSSWLDTIL